MLYDVFISHASEDKDSFVRILAEKLRESHVEVWYDEFSLKVGDSIRRSIDLGLAKSRFGIVVLSRHFINKQWTQWELDGLVQRYNRGQNGVILPIWHDIGIDEIINFSPSLADKMAISSSRGMDNIVTELIKVIRPEGSALVGARECLINYGFEPPVVTDDWWLDVLEYMGSDFSLQHWGFPLTPASYDKYSRGEQIAWAAMQKSWQERAEYEEISQMSHPSEVLDFITTCPGLAEMCHARLERLALFAPQLIVKGLGGPFEQSFEEWLQKSINRSNIEREHNSIAGSALTVNGLAPACDKKLALRHPTFGDYEPGTIACSFVQGELFGPITKVYETFDYVIWILSSSSKWLPLETRDYLLKGFISWDVWTWHNYDTHVVEKLELKGSYAGGLISCLLNTKTLKSFKLTSGARKDLDARILHSIYYLGLEEESSVLSERFLKAGLIEGWLKANTRRRSKQSRQQK